MNSTVAQEMLLIAEY